MTEHSRRKFITKTAAGSAAVAVPLLAGTTVATAAEENTDAPAELKPLSITPQDSRYTGLVTGSNQRWVGTPDYVRMVRSTDEAVEAVQTAVDRGLRIGIRSGGHCNEDFTTSGVRALIDMSAMDRVYYDERRGAFAVETGATLGRLYQTLYREWGVTLPGGVCPIVGVGGHVAGGGYGALSRRFGLTVDHLYAVEVVVVDKSGTARKVVATSDPGDPNRDLWWGHTGAGGGNFGVVTRYWLRTPGTAGTTPERQLPRPPAELIVSDVSWSWADMDERSFSRLLRNFGKWHERNSAPDSPYTGLFSQLKPAHKAAGSFAMSTQIDVAIPHADKVLDEFLAAVNAGTGLTYKVNDRSRVPWNYAAKEWFGFVTVSISRWKVKNAYMRKGFPDSQLKAFYKQLTRTDYANGSALVVIAGFGGQINAPASSDTAVGQRDSILKLMYVTLWTNPAEDEQHMRWLRDFYADVYAETGGVPGIGEVNDGCYINYADADLADPALNTSGVPWHWLYFKDGYARLQEVKARWDPGNVFTHRLAIRV